MAENGETENVAVKSEEEEQEKEQEQKSETEEQGQGEPMETVDADVTRTEDYQKLIDYGINVKVASELDKIYQSGLLQHSDLDERALDALKEFPPEGGVAVLKEFAESNLEHVSNKSAYLCGVMKTYRQKNKMPGGPDSAPGAKKGPDETKLKEILERTGYSLDVTTGQRKYGGPPPNFDGIQPGAGHEVFCGKIPKDIFEDELIPLFEKCGNIWDLRLMMDPMTGLNRGFCFVTFSQRSGAQEAVKQLDNYEIRKAKHLKVNISVANLRLFVGNIPKSKSKDEIEEEFRKITDGLIDVIIYSSPDDTKKKNRGFAFLEYETHKAASLAKRRLSTGRIKVWGCDIIVDWADPVEEPDDETMSKVKVLYVRNLKSDISEEQIKEAFEPYGKIEKVKKIKDYGFIHFEERDSAVKAMDELNGQKIGDSEIEISLAKPPSENRQKEKRKREDQKRMMVMMGRGGYDDYWGPPGRVPPPPGGRGRMMRPPPPPGRGGGGGGGGYDYDYDYYGYEGYRGGYNDPYYDDYYGGYEDYEYSSSYGGGYGPGPRGRGRGGPPPPPGPRGRGGAPPRGGRGGGNPVGRGNRGARGGAAGARGGTAAGRAARGGAGGRGGQQRGFGKRKMGGDHNQGQTKKRLTQDGNWGAQPIAQQPLNQSEGYDSQWYQDSYGQQWG